MDQVVGYKMNLPPDVDRWVRIEAAKACRSRSGQIIFLLRERMQMTAGAKASETSPAVIEKSTALQGGLPINKG